MSHTKCFKQYGIGRRWSIGKTCHDNHPWKCGENTSVCVWRLLENSWWCFEVFKGEGSVKVTGFVKHEELDLSWWQCPHPITNLCSPVNFLLKATWGHFLANLIHQISYLQISFSSPRWGCNSEVAVLMLLLRSGVKNGRSLTCFQKRSESKISRKS